jgi:S1/P1 Nuclease
MCRTSLILGTLLAFSMVSAAQAWNRIGHMTVAGIAYDELTPAEQKKLAEILTHLSNNDRMLTGLADSADDPRALVMAASTWPDLIKSDSDNYFNNGYDEPGPLESISASAGEKDGKLPMHKGWHFIDTPYNLDTKKDGSPLNNNVVNIVQVLKVLDKQLRQSMDKEERAYEMAWLLHLVGDIHQPLHCAQGFDAQNPKGDVGGNNIITDDPITHEKELHAFWDDVLGKDTPSKIHQLRLDLDVVKSSEVISNIGHAAIPANALDIDFQKWADDTHKLAVDDAYGKLNIDVVELQHGDKTADSVTIDEDYHSMADRIARKQVYLAGHRLAALLKTYLQN